MAAEDGGGEGCGAGVKAGVRGHIRGSVGGDPIRSCLMKACCEALLATVLM